MKQKFLSFFQKIFLLVLSLGVALVIAEASVRILFPQLRIVQENVYEYDKNKGYCLKKNLELGSFKTNALGYKDSKINNEAEITILAIGDSHTYGAGVSQDRIYPSILEKNLSAKTGKEIEVINGGVPSYGWLEEYEVLKEALNDFDLDIVIFQMSWNDINDNCIGIPKYLIDRKGNLIYHYSKKRPGGYDKWGMKTTEISKWKIFALKHSHLATFIIGTWNKILFNLNRDKIHKEIDQYKWEISEKTLKRIKDLVDLHQIEIFAVIHPGARPEGTKRVEEMTKRIIELLGKYKISYLDLNDGMRTMDKPTDLYLGEEDPHFNEKGYLWMSNMIEEAIIQQLSKKDRKGKYAQYPQ